jgi:hypothetical protein
LELTDEEGNYYLGPDLTLRRCSLVTRVSAKWLHIRSARFIDCAIEVKRELKNHQDWVTAALEGCRFKGNLSGCDFGHWPRFTDGWERGSIENCDFSEARLNGCRFHTCDTRTLRFPSWPCFTILDPLHNVRRLAAVNWPGDINSVTLEVLAEQPPSVVAVTWYAPSFAKQRGTTPEALKAVIEQFDCIIR